MDDKRSMGVAGDSQSNITSVISSSGRSVPGSSSAQLPQSLMGAASSPIRGRSSSLPSSSDGPSPSIAARRLPLDAPTNQLASPQSAQQDQDKANSQEASTTVNLASNSTFPTGINVTQIAAPADQDPAQDSSISSISSQEAKQTQSASAASSGSGEGSDQQAQQRIQLGPLDGQQVKLPTKFQTRPLRPITASPTCAAWHSHFAQFFLDVPFLTVINIV